MRTPSLRVLLVVAAVVVLATAALTVALVIEPVRPHTRELLLVALLGGMLFFARRAPLPLGPTQRLMVGTAPLFAATLLLSTPLVMGIAAATALLAERSRRAPWPQASFNAAAVALQVAVGATVYSRAAATIQLAALPEVTVPVAAVLAALAMYAVNVVLVEVVVAVQIGRIAPLDIWRRRRLDGPSDGALYTLGLLIAMLATDHAWVVVLLAVPALVFYRGLRQSLTLQEQLAHRARHDELTDLGNRSFFTERAQLALARAARGRGSLAVLFLDIDGFKRVNDTLGHSVGDELLTVIAGRLVRSVRPGDTVARLGGDEFIILLEQHTAAAAVQVAERLLTALRAPVTLVGRPLLVDASVGVVQSSGRDSVEDLLRSADIAMYRAKALGKGRVECFVPAMATAVREQAAWEAELRQAVVCDQFILHYQPTIDLASGRITGCEALLRWQHPTRGLVMPNDFIPLTEETGLIVPLGRWVLREACAQQRRWRDSNPDSPSLAISINLSVRQLQVASLVDEVAAILAETGVAPTSVILEVTESAMLQDADAALLTLQNLKALGVRLALDDFGTGYSSLNYLHRFPFDILKIDKAFIDPLTVASRHASLARTIVEMGRSLRLETVAEGIETVAQAETLRLLGCAYGQGYLFARPMTAEALEDWVRSGEAAGSEAPIARMLRLVS